MALRSLTNPENDAGTLRILLVEDSDIDRELARRLLTLMWPHRDELLVEYASEGGEAFEMIRSASYALMVLDWRLPGMGGGRLLNLLQREGLRVPVVVLTGLEKNELPADLDSYGAVYLHKDDLNLAKLHQAIATALSNVLRTNTPALQASVA